MNVLAAAVQSAINNATGTVDDVSVSYSDSKFNITSGSTGTSSTINVNTHPNDDAAGTLGLTGKSGTGTDQEGAEMVFQIGSNENQAMSITISDMRSEALEISSSTVQSGFSSSKNVTNGTNNTGVEYGLNVTSTDDAAAAITAIDNAISSVSAERSKLGSYQNRLEHTINNLGTSAENLTAAESRIRDTDMAKEMMNFTKQNILSQAAQSMLAQANQMPQGVLKLLQ
ncbi:MAG: hypothetical protein K9L17_03575 [Clostridiales bacterium]|nr:hypothetical protein [Clostridiales bacterium]MCF8021759.1 hypothetical protein [Clostridiales bacterium]